MGVGGRGETHHESAQSAQVTNEHHGHAGEGRLGEAELRACRKASPFLSSFPASPYLCKALSRCPLGKIPREPGRISRTPLGGAQRAFSTPPCPAPASLPETPERCRKACYRGSSDVGGGRTGAAGGSRGGSGGFGVGGERRSFLMTHPPFRGGSRGVGGEGKLITKAPKAPK